VGKRVERRLAHMLRSKMVMVLLLVIDHVRCGEMAECRRRVLMETGRHHGCDWWNREARGRLHHKARPREQNDECNTGDRVATAVRLLGGAVRTVAKCGTVCTRAEVEDARRRAGSWIPGYVAKDVNVKKICRSGQSSNGLLLTTAVRQGTI
jgi:hypothetical protein